MATKENELELSVSLDKQRNSFIYNHPRVTSLLFFGIVPFAIGSAIGVLAYDYTHELTNNDGVSLLAGSVAGVVIGLATKRIAEITVYSHVNRLLAPWQEKLDY